MEVADCVAVRVYVLLFPIPWLPVGEETAREGQHQTTARYARKEGGEGEKKEVKRCRVKSWFWFSEFRK